MDYYINLFKHSKSIFFSDINTYFYLNNYNGSKNIKYTNRNIQSIMLLLTVLKKSLNQSYDTQINNLIFQLTKDYIYKNYIINKNKAKIIYENLLKNDNFIETVSKIDKNIFKKFTLKNIYNKLNIYFLKNKINFKFYSIILSFKKLKDYIKESK